MEEWREIEVSCATCGEPTPVEVTPGGRARNGHFSTVLVAERDRFSEDVEFPTKMDKIASFDMDEDNHAGVYAECPDCCPKCNEE